MRLTVRVFGVELLDIELAADDDVDEQAEPVPFGFDTPR